MSIHTHIEALAHKREELKKSISEESSHPCPNLALVTELKKQNLAIKQEMQHCYIELRQQAS